MVGANTIRHHPSSTGILVLILALSGCSEGLEPVGTSNSVRDLETLGRTFYVDATAGDDSLDGTATDRAWKTVEMVNQADILPGDQVLFKRGEVFRGPLETRSGTAEQPIAYRAYGEGSKPVILGSVSAANPTQWTLYADGLWQTTSKYYVDVGNIYLSNGQDLTVGQRKFSVGGLLKEFDFFYTPSKQVIIKMAENPADRFTVVELALGENVVELGSNSHLRFENLHVRFGAWCGFRGSNINDVEIRSCDMSYLGGKKIWGGFQRHGNGFTVYGELKDVRLVGNRIWEIYDSGISNQYYGSEARIHKDIEYTNNIIWNTAMAGFEMANTGPGKFENITVRHNTVAFRGKGWGSRSGEHRNPDGSTRPQSQVTGANLTIAKVAALAKNVLITNNVFAESDRYLLWLYAGTPWYEGALSLKGNCWFDSSGSGFNLVEKKAYSFSEADAFSADTGFGTRSFFADPQFLDAEAGNFTLSPTSPCRAKGRIAVVPVDLLGNPRPGGRAIDMGAIESGGEDSVRYTFFEVPPYQSNP